MEFNLEKYGYNKKEVDVYLKKLTQEFEQTSQKQRDRIEELQKDIQIVEQELGRYKEKDADISTALVAAVETAKQIEESSKSIYDLEIRRIRSLYDKWQAYLDEMMERYPAMRENFDPSSITAAFKKSIDDVLSKNDEEIQAVNSVGIRNLISKMNSANGAVKEKVQVVKDTQKVIKRKPKPSKDIALKKNIDSVMEEELKRLNVLNLDGIKNGKKSPVEEFLNAELSHDLEETAYSKNILKKKNQDTGFDLKEALTPTEDLLDIMKAFDIDRD